MAEFTPREPRASRGAGSAGNASRRAAQHGAAQHRAPQHRATPRPQTPAQQPHMRRAPRGQQPASRHTGAPARSQAHHRSRWPKVLAGLAVLALVSLAIWGIAGALGGLLGGGGNANTAGGATGSDDASVNAPATIQEAGGGPGDIVIGLNGDADTMVLVGEDYLEAGAHATSPTAGILTPQIETTGTVDTQTPGDYTVTYTVKDGAGHTAQATRQVHVVEDMETMSGGIPILMYHYVYTADAPPEHLDNNYILDTDLDAQLAYLTENDFYFASFPEIRAFIEGTHSLPARSIALTFDDAEYGFLTIGADVLERHQVPATSFAIAGNEGMTDALIQNASPYISYESHSYNMHRAGGTVGRGGIISALSQDEIRSDLVQSQEVVGSGQAFAYPFGDVTDTARAAVDEAGFLCAFTTKNSWAHVGDDVRALPRVRISGEYTLDGFISLVTG